MTPFEDSGNTAGFTDSDPDGFEEESNAGGWPCVSPVPLPPPADAGGVRPFDGLTVLPLRRGVTFPSDSKMSRFLASLPRLIVPPFRSSAAAHWARSVFPFTASASRLMMALVFQFLSCFQC